MHDTTLTGNLIIQRNIVTFIEWFFSVLDVVYVYVVYVYVVYVFVVYVYVVYV